MANEIKVTKKLKTITKGSLIIGLVNKGLTNDKILEKVDTTLNSIRWYRSKINKGHFPQVWIKLR